MDAFPGQTFEGEVSQVRKAAQSVANVVTYVAVVAFSNTLAEFPDAPYREEALYLKADAAFRLAENSVDEKKPLRMKEAQTACREAVSLFPEGRFVKELQRIQTKIDAYLQKNS